MKKLNYLLGLFLIAALSFSFTSCDDEEVDAIAPSITLTQETGYINADAIVTPNAELKFKVDIRKGDANMEKLTLTEGGQHVADSPYEDVDGSADVVEITFDAKANEGNYVYKFEVTDKDGETASVSVTITVEVSGGAITTYSSKILGAHQSTSGSSFASTNGTVYSLADAATNSTLIDFMYFYGATNEATIAAPDDTDAATVFDLSGFATKNATRFATANSVDFANVTDDVEIISAATSASSTKINHLAIGNVIAFKTAAGKMGLLSITAMTTGATGDITIDVKVQE
ncbi:MAG: hypothetical protein KAT68_02225 [Bacteroidales bacterium]|nr:hypothetical protein [Bacteroidales bacterium]